MIEIDWETRTSWLYADVCEFLSNFGHNGYFKFENY